MQRRDCILTVVPDVMSAPSRPQPASARNKPMCTFHLNAGLRGTNEDPKAYHRHGKIVARPAVAHVRSSFGA